MVNGLKKFFFALLFAGAIALMCVIAFLVSGIWQVDAAGQPMYSANTAAELIKILNGIDSNLEINYTGADVTAPITIPAGKNVTIHGLSMTRTFSDGALITVNAGASLTLVRSTLDGNAIASDVAAIAVFGTLTVGEGTTVTNCVCLGYGAAIYAASHSNVTVLPGATVSGKALYGDAIYIAAGSK